MHYTDLHCHLGGATPIHTLKELAYENNLEYNKVSYTTFAKSLLEVGHKNKFIGYLRRYDTIQNITSNPMAIELSVYHAIATAYLYHNIDLLELKFNPMLRNKGGYYDLDVIIMSAINGLQKAKSIYPEIKVGLIIESDRSFSNKLTDILVQKAIKYKELGIVGFDISGYDTDFKFNGYHSEIFQALKAAGLGITIHSNELLYEPELLRLGLLQYVDRIGHGVQLMVCRNAEQLISRCYDQNANLAFEICSQSNLNSGVLDEQSLCKLSNFIYNNCYRFKFAICSDGFLFNGGIKQQFQLLSDHCQHSYDDIAEYLINQSRSLTFNR